MVERIFDLLPYYEANFRPKTDVLAGKVNGKWVGYSLKQYREAVDAISCALIGLGIQPGDKIATIAVSMPEWNFVDMAILQIGAVHVPIYPTISEADYRYILSHSGVRLVFISGCDMYRKIKDILPELPAIEKVYSFRPCENISLLSELIDQGRSNPCREELEKRKSAVKPGDVATLIYTSGTTGNPKGVMLTHANLLSNVLAVKHIFPVDQTCRAVSYLPLCHVYERMNIYTYHYLGVSVYYAENMGTIADNIREVSPEILTTVPRLLEKVFDKIMAKGEKLKGLKRILFHRAVELGMQYDPYAGNSLWFRLRLWLMRKLVFSKWQEALGGRMRVIVSGGAALQPRLVRIFAAAGIPVLEGYGLTETSPVIAVNTLEPNGMMPGTVGKVIKDVAVRISDEGEILVKGPNVMKGYFNAPELTAAAIDAGGWFHTGDKGQLEPTGHLRITGRIKEIFKTSMGKYISPALIENKFKESPFIDGIIVLGENQKFAAALITPSFEHLRAWCRQQGISYTTDSEMIQHKEVRKRIKAEVDELNKQFGDYEQIKKFDLIDHEWSVQTGELTANLKLKRAFITQKYASQIEALFA
ncbi:MAG: long-chain fatty acid--CoA ligase [Bacteroidetes bacterium]|nr:long-chain fatty acid--CoA ligase [Bacteroidota bacterium]